MAQKTKQEFVCKNCSYAVPRWQGRCPSCGEWNTFEEQVVRVTTKTSGGQRSGTVVRLSELVPWQQERISGGLSELDLVLGGGFVPGSLVLLGGDPGVGKSTLALQVAVFLDQTNASVLYVSGEESAQQIRLRAHRLNNKTDLRILSETNLEIILATLANEKPQLAVIDSVQTLNSDQVNGVVGGVSQIAFATNSLMRLAKEQHTTIVIIGHVTKEGVLAGPKTLEHMVDTVMYLEGERFSELRLLRCVKNRFGSTGEVGVFEMHEKGLVEVQNPAALFLEHRTEQLPGTAIAPILEGNKVLMLEIQALTSKTAFGYPRRAANGFDVNRLQLLLAIVQKRYGVDMSNQDVYVNIAGGFTIDERAADLPVVLSILSSFYNTALPNGLVSFGEIGLSGEIRTVPSVDKRLSESQKLGFTSAVVSARAHSAKMKSLAVSPLSTITDIQRLFPTATHK